MTTGISLVRENAQSMAPPRSLWVSFPLGRPLGKPGDPAFQHQVIAAALDLLERSEGPVLEDFPLDVPLIDSTNAPACPVTFARPTPGATTWQAMFADELLLLKPWYDLSRRRRGRTTVGVSGDSIDQILAKLGGFLDQGSEAFFAGRPDLKWFKLAMEDAKAFYGEALTAQPGDYSIEQIQTLMWGQTRLGAGLAVFYEWFRSNPKLELFARLVASREAMGESTGSELIIGLPSAENSDD